MAGIPADILLYAFIALGLVFWLKSILGTRHGDERERGNPFLDIEIKIEKQGDNVTPFPGYKNNTSNSADPAEKDEIVLPRNVSINTKTAQRGLDDIQNLDSDFNLSDFATAVQDAFVIIVEGFAKGERDTLKDLLSDKVYDAFDNAITQREARGESVETQVHAIRQLDFIDAECEGRQAKITLRFTMDETCVIKNKEGEIISGDPDKVGEVIDIWTFARDIKSNDPRWLLVETRDGDVVEDHKTPLPDSHS